MTGAEASAIDQLRTDVRDGFKGVNGAIGKLADLMDKHNERLTSLETTRTTQQAIALDREVRKSSRREKLATLMGLVGFMVGVLSTLHSLGLY